MKSTIITHIDWSNEEDVVKFYNSFKEWNFYIKNKDVRQAIVGEIKNNILYFENKYYLPAANLLKKTDLFLQDGMYYAYVYEKIIDDKKIYVYIPENKKPYSKKEIENFSKRNSYTFRDEEKDLKYIKTLDIKRINSKELHFIRSHVYELFSDFLPFKSKNNIKIGKWLFSEPLSCTKGLLYIDNSYPGPFINKMDYGLMFKYHPSFSNEAKYFVSYYFDKFDKNALEGISIEIEKSIKNFCHI